MKKIITFGLLVLFFQLFLFFSYAIEENRKLAEGEEGGFGGLETSFGSGGFVANSASLDVVEGWNFCEFRGTQINQVEEIVDMFHKYSEARIVKRLFSNSDYQNLVRILTENLIVSLENTLSICRDQQWDLYDGNTPMSLGAIKDMLREYVDTLITLKQFVEKKPSGDVIAFHIKDLQEIIFGKRNDYIHTNSFLKEEAKISFDVNFASIENTKADLSLDIDTISVGDAWGTTIDSDSTVSGVMNITMDGGGLVDFRTRFDFFVRLVDGRLYIKFDNLNLDIVSQDIDKYSQQDIDAFVNMAKLMEGKRFDVFEGLEGDVNAFVGMLGQNVRQEQDGFVMDILGTKRITTYRIENDVAYGGLDPLVCANFAFMGLSNDCLETWMNMYDISNGWGLLEMHMYKDAVGFSLSRKIPIDILPDEMRNLVGKDFISWSKNKINLIKFPFGDYGEFVYKDGKISGDIKIPNIKYDRKTDMYTEVFTVVKINGLLQGDELKIKGSILGNGFNVQGNFDKLGDSDNLRINVRFDIENEGEGFDISIDASIDTQVTTIAPVDIVAPDEKDIVALDNL